MGVAEHLLDEADIGAVFQHQGGHGVAEQVAAAVLVHVGQVQADQLARRMPVE